MNARYWMSLRSRRVVDHWQPCNARTLGGAKAEATRKINYAYGADCPQIGENFETNFAIVAWKPGRRWLAVHPDQREYISHPY